MDPGYQDQIKYLHPKIEVLFLPPNMTALLQPLGEGITAIFKVYYLHKLLMERYNENYKTLSE